MYVRDEVMPMSYTKNSKTPTTQAQVKTNEKRTFAVSNEIKLIIVGNVGSGKTTAIIEASETPVIGTEAKATARDKHRKPTTTVAMEYGSMQMQKTKLHLYGTPGQRRFDFMASILCNGATGMVVMIDNGCNDPIGELNYFLTLHKDFLTNNPAIIAITHCDDIRSRTNLIDYHTFAIQHGFKIPVMRVDARVKTQVKTAILKLLIAIIRKKGSAK